MNNATISADVISYTLLPETEKRKLENGIKLLLGELSLKYYQEGFYGRMVQGDYIECALRSPKYAFRIALIIKTFIKSLWYDIPEKEKSRLKYFLDHGIRLAIAVAPLQTVNPETGIIDGEAIYMSGRAIKNLSTSFKQKIVIKSTMFFRHSDPLIQEQFETFFVLTDTILSRCSARQSAVICYKLLNLSEKEISEKLEKKQSTISQHSTAAGWISIEKAINYFENTIS
jgi:hypothetical protein